MLVNVLVCVWDGGTWGALDRSSRSLPAQPQAISPSDLLAYEPMVDHMTSVPLHFKSLTDVSRMIESGDITSVEATTHLLERIDRVDGQLHSYIHVCAERAMAKARAADAERAVGVCRGPCMVSRLPSRTCATPPMLRPGRGQRSLRGIWPRTMRPSWTGLRSQAL